jgi:hypothetical protein
MIDVWLFTVKNKNKTKKTKFFLLSPQSLEVPKIKIRKTLFSLFYFYFWLWRVKRLSFKKVSFSLCLFRRSYELICAWKGWLYVSLWKLLFVFLYHLHFGGIWTTFLQIIMLKFNVMNFHHSKQFWSDQSADDQNETSKRNQLPHDPTTNSGIRSNSLWSHHLNPDTEIGKCTKKSCPLRHKWLHQQNTRMRDKHN